MFSSTNNNWNGSSLDKQIWSGEQQVFQQAGGQPLRQAPPLPARNVNSRQYRPIRLKTHDWGKKNENGWSKFNRSVYFGQPEFERGYPMVPAAPSAAGLQRSRAFNQRRINLRSHNWGQRSNNGWSGFNNSMYQPQNLASWEHKSAILEELRAKFRALPVLSAALPAAPATIVPVNMLPAPINDGAKYEKLIGNKRGSRRYRRNLKQPLTTHAISPLAATASPISAQPAGLSPFGTGLLNNGYGLQAAPATRNGKLSRKERKAIVRNSQSNLLSSSLATGPVLGAPLASAPLMSAPIAPLATLTPLGTSATSGLTGLPASNRDAKLTRKQRRALKKNNNLAVAPNNGFTGLPTTTGFTGLPTTTGFNGLPTTTGFTGLPTTTGFTGLPATGLAAPVAPAAPVNQKLTRKQRRALKKNNSNAVVFSGNVLPASLPVNNAIPVTNVISSPVLSSAAPLAAAPLGSTFIKTEQPIIPNYAIGRSAF